MTTTTNKTTTLPENIEELLVRLADNSRGELDLVRTLGDAIRRVDEQLLREVRSVTLAHEIRREAILGELHHLANRLCALPVATHHQPRTTIEQQPQRVEPPVVNGNGGDWRQAAQAIKDDGEFAFDVPAPRH